MTPDLSEPIDVYSEWIDACEEAKYKVDADPEPHTPLEKNGREKSPGLPGKTEIVVDKNGVPLNLNESDLEDLENELF